MTLVVLGVFGTVLSMIGLLPTVFSVYVQHRAGRKAEGVSALTYGLLGADLAMWSLYGALTGGVWQMIACGVGSVGSLLIVVLLNDRRSVILIVIGAIVGCACAMMDIPGALGALATVVSMGMFVPQVSRCLPSVLRGSLPEGVTVGGVGMQMIATPGVWGVYGAILGSTWTWVSAIPQVLCGVLVLAVPMFHVAASMWVKTRTSGSVSVHDHTTSFSSPA